MRAIYNWLNQIEISDRQAAAAFKGYSVLVYAFLYFPVIVVILLSFTERRVPYFPMEGFSLKWYAQLVPPGYDERLIDALFTSLQIGVLSSLGSSIIGTLAALGMVRGEFGSRYLRSDVLSTFFLSPIVIPWIVTGIAVVTLYNLIGIQGTFASIVIGHILISLPFAIVVISSQLYGFDRSLEEAAKSLGASRLRTFYEVTLPLIAPGIIAAMLFAFTISFDNFTQTFFWTGSDVQTLPIVIYSKIQFGLEPTVNAIGTIIVMLSLSVAMVAEKLSSRVV